MIHRLCALGLMLCLLAAPALCAQPIISEFMAANDTVLADQDGSYSDWIELYHAGPGTLSLNGYYLTDDANQLTKWRLPAQTMAANSYLVIFASGKNRTVAGNELHTNFALDAAGEYLALVAPDGVTVVCDFGPKYRPQYRDVAYGFQTQGTNPTLRTSQAGYLISHTPGAANTVIPGPHPLYCDTSLARIEITASQAVWNGLQASTPTNVEGVVGVRFRHGDIDVTVTNVGIQARGNTSLTKYPRSFRISFNSFVPGQNLFGIEKLNLNSEANDPATARSKLFFDLSERAGLASEYANHVATVIIGPTNHRSGPNTIFFDAVLNNTQPVDDVFVQQRFANPRGNLYKCTYTGAGPANLTYKGPTGNSYSGLSTYELRYAGTGDTSFNDLAQFINVLNNTPTSAFAATIRKHFAVDDFLKRLALDVLTANWDGYWGNWNNYHLYRDPGTGRWHYLPFDADNTFSIQWITPSSGSWATQNIYTWGRSTDTPLVTRILNVTEFRHRYSYFLHRMLQDFYQNAALNPLVYRIRENQTAPLPFGGLGITNCKLADRGRYSGDWPNWTYSQYFNSYDQAQVSANGSVPNYHGITQFITERRASALSQLNLVNIGPLVAELKVTPTLPATNQTLVVSARIEDDVSINSARLIYQFNGGASVTNTMVDNGTGADDVAGDRMYTTQIGPFGIPGTLTYYVQATDNQGKSTFEPWGGATDAATVVIGSPLLGLALTEIQYNPHEPSGSELNVSTNAQDYEFLELQNLGSTTLNLGGVNFLSGITYAFPAHNLAPAARVVIAKNLAAFTARYGAGINVLGPFGGQLSNSGEELHLVDANGATLHQFAFNDSGLWPRRADGCGSSLELIDPAGNYSAGTNWLASLDYGGSPGTAGRLPTAGVVINEVLSHTDPPLTDAIELHNPTEAGISIGGWYLSDTDAPYKKYRIPAGTVLPAGGYLTFDEANHFNRSGGTNPADFALSSQGEELWLLEGDAQSNLVAFVDFVSFGAARNGESFGRWPNGQGQLYPMTSRTFGALNSGPRVGPVIIGELMYAPPAGNLLLEFVEILNAGMQAETLDNWTLAGDINYSFPSNTVLLPGEVLVVLPFDPHLPANAGSLNAFRTHYGLAADAPLIGGYLGSLPDASGTLRLLRPDAPPAGDPTFFPMLLEDEVSYLADLPWPVAAAGNGSALLRTASDAWGLHPQSWTASPLPFATPGTPPLADADGDGLPDSYELGTYGSLTVVGETSRGDTDGDGLSDVAEHRAGTSATNANSRFELSVTTLTSGEARVELPTQAITGPGYFGLQRWYRLESTLAFGTPVVWAPIPGYEKLAATGETLIHTNAIASPFWAVRAQVWLE